MFEKVNKNCFIYSIAVAIVCFTIHIYILLNGHLHEDAYILFQYVQNIIEGHGIVYFPGGERAEGATDFLWLILLSSVSFISTVDVAVVAALINSLGLMLLSYLLLQQLGVIKGVFQHILSFLLLGMLLISPMTSASLGGFSTLFYASISTLLLSLYWSGDDNKILAVPLVAIVLALVRPDGVIVGVGFCLLSLYELRRSPLIKKLILRVTLAALIGISYFAWRYGYFGNLLPLPLYVKVTNTTGNTGWLINYSWLTKSYVTALFIAMFALIVFLLDKKDRLKLLKTSLPFVLLFIALGMSHQSQNIANRFQAPIYAYLLFFLAVLIRRSVHAKNIKILVVPLIVLVVGVHSQHKRFVKELDNLMARSYINYFPSLLSVHMSKETVIALTEAGRMAFWNDAQVHDLVGLNTVYTARHGASVEYLDRIDPDLIFVHQAGILKTVVLEQQVKEIEVAKTRELIDERYDGVDLEALNPVQRAPLVALQYLAKTPDDWRVFLVQYGEQYGHLYAVKESGRLDVKSFIGSLDKSFEATHQKPYSVLRTK